MGIVTLVGACLHAQRAEDVLIMLTKELTEQRLEAADLRVVYRSPVHYDSGPRAGYSADIIRTVAFRGTSSILYEVQHEDRRTRRDEWPEWVRHVVVGDRWLLEWPCKRLYCLTSLVGSRMPAAIWEDPLLACSGWWPLNCEHSAGTFGGLSFDLMATATDPRCVAESTGSRLVLKRRHPKSGVTERSELDSERGWAVLRRTWSNASGELLLEAVVQRHERVLSRLWLPAEFTMRAPVRTYMVEDDAWRRLVTGHLVSCEVKPFEGSLWDISPAPLPGLARYDELTGGITQVIPGGQDYLVVEGDRLGRLAAEVQWLKGARWEVVFVAAGVGIWALRKRRVSGENQDLPRSASSKGTRAPSI